MWVYLNDIPLFIELMMTQLYIHTGTQIQLMGKADYIVSVPFLL